MGLLYQIVVLHQDSVRILISIVIMSSSHFCLIAVLRHQQVYQPVSKRRSVMAFAKAPI
jgi:hypothetical protein